MKTSLAPAASISLLMPRNCAACSFAEQSSVVTEPDQDHGSLLEDPSQGDLAALEVEHHTIREPRSPAASIADGSSGSDLLLYLAGIDLIPASRVY